MGKSILIIEDDPFVRESLYEILSMEGYDVAMASDGGSGLAMMESHRPHVVLVDLRLPDRSGTDVIKTAREKKSDVDFIVMTSYGTVDTAVEAMKMGATDYLTKPIN